MPPAPKGGGIKIFLYDTIQVTNWASLGRYTSLWLVCSRDLYISQFEAQQLHPTENTVRAAYDGVCQGDIRSTFLWLIQHCINIDRQINWWYLLTTVPQASLFSEHIRLEVQPIFIWYGSLLGMTDGVYCMYVDHWKLTQFRETVNNNPKIWYILQLLIQTNSNIVPRPSW